MHKLIRFVVLAIIAYRRHLLVNRQLFTTGSRDFDSFEKGTFCPRCRFFHWSFLYKLAIVAFQIA